MITNTQQAIEIIKRMDLKVAVPTKFQPPSIYEDSVMTTIEAQTIHVPSIIAALQHEIRMAKLETEDVKKATRILLDIKKE